MILALSQQFQEHICFMCVLAIVLSLFWGKNTLWNKPEFILFFLCAGGVRSSDAIFARALRLGS